MLTIAMIVYNEENQLQRVQQNIALLRGRQVAVLVIDNASTDGSPVSLRRLCQTFGAQLVTREHNHMGAARSQAVQLAQGEWLGFIDADCEIDSRWLDGVLLRIKKNPAVAALGGPLLPGGEKRFFYERLFKSFWGNVNSAQVKNFVSEKQVRHLSTANVIYRRADLIEVGNFALDKVRVGEDLDMSYRLTRRGKKLQFSPELKLTHVLPVGYRPWLKKVFLYGRARGEVGYDHGVLWSYPFLLPLLFLFFISANLVLWPVLGGWPLLVYLLAILLNAIFYGRRDGLVMFGYFVSMHLAYSAGMALGLFQKFNGVSHAADA